MKSFLLLRTLLPAICAAGSMSVSSSAGAAEPFPSKVVRIIIPATPGGGGDTLMRPFSQKLGAAWGQPVILDYRPGGGTVLGTALAAKSPPDGYTIVLVQTSFSINASLRKSLPFDSVPHVRAGRVRAVAVTTAKRMPLMPEVPTIAESGVAGYESSSWTGLLAPAGTPGATISRLNADIRQVLLAADTREAIARDGGEAVGGTPEEFGAMIRSEIGKWAKVIKAHGIKDE